MEENKKRIPGGVYHRFAEERAGKLGAEQKVLSIEPGGLFLYMLHKFSFPRLIRTFTHESLCPCPLLTLTNYPRWLPFIYR
jgi:hypothetical protein